MSYKNKLSTLGFTLIELLVVISIIGLISTIVLVSTKGSRDKARLAKVKQFSSQVNHALGAYAVGIWRFEEGEGIDIHDESGYGNHGTFHGNPTPVFPDGVYSGTTALQFDGVDDYVDCGNDESLNITDEITVSAWVKTNNANDFQSIVTKANHVTNVGWDFDLEAGGSIRFILQDSSGYGVTGAGTVSSNEWYHVVGVRDGDAIYVYINGIKKGSDSGNAGVDATSSEPFRIGARGGNNPEYFNGAIDEVRIYNRALSAAEIKKHYTAGAAKHGIAINDK